MRCASRKSAVVWLAAQSLSAMRRFSRWPVRNASACRVATVVSAPNETSVLTTSCRAGRRSW